MLSVIIPIFNTGKYLDKCLTTVTRQTYQDLDIILINDCSTDKKTIETIKKWVNKDKRIRLIDKKENEGVDRARVTGIYASNGVYLTFVDSDDWLPLNAFEIMMQKMVDTDADMLKGNANNMWFGGFLKRAISPNPSIINREILHDELMEKYYISYFGVNIIPVTLWGTIFRKSLFINANIQASGLQFGEDLVMNMKIFPYVKKFYFTDEIVYYYRQGLPSMSGKYLDKWLCNFDKLYKIKMDQIEDTRYDKAIYYQKVELINYLKSFVIGCNRYRKGKIQGSIAELQEELKEPIYRNLVSYMKNEKSTALATFLEQGDAKEFWKYVSEQQQRTMPLNKVILNSIFTFLRLLHR